MTIDVNYVLERLSTQQIESGGYYGTDITKLSKELGVTPRGLRKQTDLYQFLSEAKYSWFKVRGIEIPNDYSVYDERNTLSTLFMFSDLKAYGGADLQDIFNRLINAKRHIEKYGINAFEFYPQILNRGSNLRSLLSSIPPRQQEETQARLIFETQLAYVVECTDLFVNEIIRRKGRIHQSMNAHRQKVENLIREEELEVLVR